ncbi:MAG: HypC/HybG/HupF family hydrogenase formation chaperone [Kiritimatiellaeota bacterium]|nr:HypC/HybG/HupF family hydrogenase formation chaperone [Kiritimatiellota bacterium]
MCLAVPAKIIELHDTEALVDIDGIRRTANVAFIEAPAVGDYVLLHAGFAIRKWSEEDVAEYREILASSGIGSAPDSTV